MAQNTNRGVTRRRFLEGTGSGLALTALNRRALFGASPNEQISLGMIGVGSMGMSRLRGFMEHSDVRISAVCDVDQDHVERAVEEVKKKRDNKPKHYRDFRSLLDSNDVDAVVIVTPDHWHAVPAVQACQAGKDVFVEKPLSYSVAEGRAMADASARFERVTQMGNHIHNDLPNYRRVVEIVRGGYLGRITRVNIWKTSFLKDLGNPPNSDPPPRLDYDLWLGPAPKRDYNPLRSHNTFRHFWDYSSGSFIDFWCHIADVAYWALDLKAPRSVSAAGGRFLLNDLTETPDTVEAVLEFPQLTFIYTYHANPPPQLEEFGHIGCIFQGTEATLVTNYEKHQVYVKGEKVQDPSPVEAIPDSPGHLREFLEAIRSRNLETTCNVRYGHRLTKGGLLAVIAYRTGERIYWDDEREETLDSPNASRLLSRAFRKPWVL